VPISLQGLKKAMVNASNGKDDPDGQNDDPCGAVHFLLPEIAISTSRV
jgi:hypothetical protein